MSVGPESFAALSALAAIGDDERTFQECRRALESDVPAAAIREIFLQGYLFLGYPRAINALAALNRALEDLGRPAAEGHPPDLSRPDPDAVRRAGEDLCRAIYGRAYEPLRRRMTELHPLLERWMLEEGYGRVLSRPDLTPREREFGVVAALVVLGVEPQLESHVRGALRVGAGPDEVRTVVETAAGLVDEGRAALARRVLDRILG